MLLFAIEKLSRNSPPDPWGQHVAGEVGAMDPHQARIARKIISDVLYVGACGKLNDDLTRLFSHISCKDDS